MIGALTFEPEGHVYRFKGRVVPSVTQVLEQLEVGSFVAAIKEAMRGQTYAAQSSAIADAIDRWQAAAEFGTHVHQACHLLNQNDLDEEALDPALIPYVNSYRLFLAETGFVVTGSEILLYHALMGYAGAADIFGDWMRADWVVDIKSGIVPKTVGAQTAAYQNAAPKKPRRRLCLRLCPAEDGRPKYELLEQKEASDFSLFTSALNVYRFNQKHYSRKDNAKRISEYT